MSQQKFSHPFSCESALKLSDLTHNNNFEKAKKLFNCINELLDIIQKDYPQIVNPDIDRRIAYLSKIRANGIEEYRKYTEKSFDKSKCEFFNMQPDDISPNQIFVYLNEFGSLDELNEWVKTGLSKAEQDYNNYYEQLSLGLDESSKFSIMSQISGNKSAVKIIQTPVKLKNGGTARKELSIHKSDAQDFEDLFGFRPNQKQFGAGNHAQQRERIKSENAREFTNSMMLHFSEVIREMIENRSDSLNEMLVRNNIPPEDYENVGILHTVVGPDFQFEILQIGDQIFMPHQIPVLED